MVEKNGESTPSKVQFLRWKASDPDLTAPLDQAFAVDPDNMESQDWVQSEHVEWLSTFLLAFDQPIWLLCVEAVRPRIIWLPRAPQKGFLILLVANSV